jgi:hypothetical protein
MLRRQSLRPALLGIGVMLAASGCDDLWHKVTGRGLSRGGDQNDEVGAQAPPQNGPKLGALADLAPIFEKPQRESRRIGWLHAGAQVTRSTQPVLKQKDCPEGWYSIYPRGFVCIGQGATIDLNHPTLSAMSLSPKLNEALPYPYAQARVPTEIFAPNNEPDDGVHSIARLRPFATFAVVGSWQALDESDQRQKLALMTQGTFVRVDDVKAAKPPPKHSVQIDGSRTSVPLGFVIGEHARLWKLSGDEATPGNALSSDAILSLGHKMRTLGDAHYCALEDGNWVQQTDIVAIRRRNDWPNFASGNRHWVDIDLQQGTIVLYEGERPTFAALTLAVPKNKTGYTTGPTVVLAKYITDKTLDPKTLDSSHEVYDVPWVVELASGLRLHGAFHPDRRSTVTSPRVELAPEDAQRVWAWVDPQLPQGWHAVTASSDVSRRTDVLVR